VDGCGKVHGGHYMESFHWDKSYVTGLPTVDDQHHRLVELINQFGDLLADNAVEFDDVEVLFGELASYAIYHFQAEETMMADMGIDLRHRDHHISEHQAFLQEVMAMHAGMAPETLNTARHLLSFLIHWLAYHILGSDQDMARQVEAIKQGSQAEAAFDKMERGRDSATEPLLIALNGLFQQVSARNRELLQLNQSLEEKVTERTRELSDANDRLKTLANTDALTGLPNRRHVMHRLAELWQESVENQKPVCCMMIDADHFKEINDAYGHDAGDVVLRELAKTLQYAVRTDDVVSRLGGDEFMVVCANTDKAGGMLVAEQIRQSVSVLRVSTADGGCWQGSVSVGLASRDAEMQSYESLLKAADNGVYEAKRAGKNCVREGVE